MMPWHNKKQTERREQHERFKVRRPCVKLLKNYERYKLLNRYQALYWVCPPDLGELNERERMEAIRDGYHAGVFDMTLIASNPELTRVWLIEFKYGKNPYTESQKKICTMFENTSVECLQIHNTEEFLKFMEKELIGDKRLRA